MRALHAKTQPGNNILFSVFLFVSFFVSLRYNMHVGYAGIFQFFGKLTMSNKGFFTGRVAKAPVFRDGGKTPVCYFTLIRDEYAGQDAGGEAQERKVAIPFTAFAGKAKAISENVFVGDQLIVEYRLANNDRPNGGETEYGYSFIVDDFDFGAPGQLKREKLAQSHPRG